MQTEKDMSTKSPNFKVFNQINPHKNHVKVVWDNNSTNPDIPHVKVIWDNDSPKRIKIFINNKIQN